MLRQYIMRLAVLVLLLGSVAACGGSSTEAAATPVPAGAASAVTAAPASTAPADPAGTATAPTVDYGRTLTVMTHDSFNASADVIAEFEQANKVNLRFLKSGDAGTVLNRAILSRNSPLADVLYGVDNTFFSRAIQEGIFEPYKPAGLDQIPADLRLDPEGRLTPIDFGFVAFNYDKAALGPGKIPVPQTLRDLTKPEYRGKIV